MELTAREVCGANGNSKLEPDGVGLLLTALRYYCAPDATGAMCQAVVSVLHMRNTTKTADEFLGKFDSPRSAEERKQAGCPAPEAFVAVTCLQNASSP